MISYNTINVKMPELPHRETTAWVKTVAASYGKRVGELAYVFCDDEKILEVNKQYLQHDYYTDIISFDYTEAPTITKKAIPTSMWCSGIKISEQWSLLCIQASRIKSVSSSFEIPLPSVSKSIARPNSGQRNTCRPSQTK